jgi:hypothetical protein
MATRSPGEGEARERRQGSPGRADDDSGPIKTGPADELAEEHYLGIAPVYQVPDTTPRTNTIVREAAIPASPVALNATAGSAYAPLIADQLVQARALKTSIEQRALAVMAAAGGLAALVFAFLALSRTLRSAAASGSAQPTAFPDPARELLGVALLLFVVAACIGLYVQTTKPYREVSARGFDQMLAETAWQLQDPVFAGRRVGELQKVLTLESRRVTGRKAYWLNIAIGLEIAAVAVLCLTVVTLMSQG